MPSFPVIRSEQYPATDEVECITVYIPAADEFKALLAGMYSLLINPYSYDEPESAQVDGLVAIWDNAYSQIDWDGCMAIIGRESEVNLWGDRANVQNGNALTLVNNQPASKHGFYVQQNPGSINDHIYFNRFMARGNWAFAYQYQRTTASAIIEIRVVDVDENIVILAAGDMYGTTLDNQMFTGTFALEFSGYKSINIKVTGRNASNTTNYLNRLTLLQMWRTED